SRRRHTRFSRDWSSDVCSSDLSSKLMCWVALDRAAKLAAIRGDNDLEAKWRAVAEEIESDILTHGVDERGVLRQHYETDALDARSEERRVGKEGRYSCEIDK